MSSAHVQSTDAIEAVRTALISFSDQVSDALTELQGEMRRVQDWLEHDRPRFWKTQIRLATDQVNEAQAALHRCLMFPVGSERPACYEERMELKKAQDRLAYCQAKAERVRHWMRALAHEMFEFDGRISKLERLVEEDAPQAIAVLSKILRQIEAYRAVRVEGAASSYNDVALVNEIWPETRLSKPVEEPEPIGEPASVGGQPANEG